MKTFVAATVLAAAFAVAPAWASLQPGAAAPDFKAPAYLAGKPFTYSLSQELKKGPVVLYFFPAAHTKGCNLEAHLFSEAIDQFKAQKASVIGVTAGKTSELADFSKETEHCGGKFPVAADNGAAIAKKYETSMQMPMAIPGMPSTIADRTSYVIAPNGKVLAAYTNRDPSDHVNQTLGAVKAWRAKNP